MEVLIILVIAVAVLAVLVGGGLALRARSRPRELERPGVPGEPLAPPGSAATATLPTPVPTEDLDVPELVVDVPDAPTLPEVREKPRLRDRLGRTRAALSGAFGALRGRTVDDETWDELEEALLLADVGIPTTQRLLNAVRALADAGNVTEPDAVLALLRDEVTELLTAGADRTLHSTPDEPNVWMFVGVNGVGKTTTIGKLAQQQVGDGRRVVLAAADTFRAAAADQLQLWADRTGGEIVRAQEGADPGSVIFDAMVAASSRNADLVLVDTAGRLHTKTNLMEELKKLRRIVDRTEGALKEVLLVIDATTGQNGLVQAKQFADAVDVSGIVLTKLDGTAKGGIVLAIQFELGIPVKAVGIGEGADDLIPFDPEEFSAALFGSDGA